MKRSLWLLLSLLLFVGCSKAIRVELEGMPAPTNVVSANLHAEAGKPMTVKYFCIRNYGEEEGDEILDTYEYMRLDPIPKVRRIPHYSRTTGIAYTIQIRNPYLIEYSLHRLFRETQDEPFIETELYKGNLSMKTVTVRLSAEEGAGGELFLQMRDEEGMIMLETFGVLYKVGKKRQRTTGMGP
jgi:hypothetical protein